MVVWLQLYLQVCDADRIRRMTLLTGKVVPTHIVLYKENEIKEHQIFLYIRQNILVLKFVSQIKPRTFVFYVRGKYERTRITKPSYYSTLLKMLVQQ